jgi:hypothetical protein
VSVLILLGPHELSILRVSCNRLFPIMSNLLNTINNAEMDNTRSVTKAQALMCHLISNLSLAFSCADLLLTYSVLFAWFRLLLYGLISPLDQKVYKKNSRTNTRTCSFSQRIVDMWNSLPKQVIETKTVNSFKSQLNNHWNNLVY